MLNKKQTKYLRSLSHDIQPIFQVGKAGVNPELVTGVKEALEKRELIKISKLPNCDEDIQTVTRMLSERARAEVVQVIGKTIVLYKESRDKKKKIELPRSSQ